MNDAAARLSRRWPGAQRGPPLPASRGSASDPLAQLERLVGGLDAKPNAPQPAAARNATRVNWSSDEVVDTPMQTMRSWSCSKSANMRLGPSGETRFVLDSSNRPVGPSAQLRVRACMNADRSSGSHPVSGITSAARQAQETKRARLSAPSPQPCARERRPAIGSITPRMSRQPMIMSSRSRRPSAKRPRVKRSKSSSDSFVAIQVAMRSATAGAIMKP